MIKFINKKIALLTVVVGSVFFLQFFYGHLISSPNTYLLTGQGDGLKSYYVMKYHIENDSSYLHFTGMNYPFGEHIGYTDGIPAITWLIQTIPFLKPHSIAIVHLSVFLSMLLSAVFVFLIFKKFNVNQWFAVAASLGILLLQPQIHRMTGHISLSYAVFFPLSWYLLIKYLEKPSKVITVFLVLNPLFWFFIHAYLGFMIVIFYLVTFLYLGIRDRKKSKLVALKNIAFTFLPLILFFSFIKLSDPITDRPKDPSGIFDYTASIKSVFLPSHPPLNSFYNSIFTDSNPVPWEGWSYIGLTTVIIIFITLVAFIVQSFAFNKEKKSSIIPKQFVPYILSGILILIFSFGFPFIIFPELLDYLSPVKQFRALGRFAWVFYYVSTIISLTLLYYWWERNKTKSKTKNILSASVVVLGISLYYFEGIPYHSNARAFLNTKNVFESNQLSETEQQLIKTASLYDVQAIMPLPYFHVGSEIFNKDASAETVRKCFLLSYYLKKPIFSVMMGRTSFQQSIDFLRTFGPPQIEKRMRNILPPEKPLLVYYGGVKLWEEEIELKKLLIPIQNIGTDELYLLYPQDLLRTEPNFTLADFKKNTDTLISYQDILIDHPITNDFFWDNFEDKEKWKEFYSNGKYRGFIKNYNTILTVPENTLQKDSTYEIGFEYFWKSSPIAVNNIVIIQTSSPGGGNIKWIYERCLFTYPIQEYGKTTFKAQFRVEDSTQVLELVLKGPENREEFEIDHLFLKKPWVNILRKNEKLQWTLNNFLLPD